MSKYVASAPGSLMLMGEHSVLYGGTAVVVAIEERVYGSLQPRQDDRIVIESNLFGRYQTTLTHLTLRPPFQFVLAALQVWYPSLSCGCTLVLETTFSTEQGLGSSAALTIVVHSLLQAWCEDQQEYTHIFKKARHSMRLAQNHLGSGADLAASLVGGVCQYTPEQMPERLGVDLRLSTAYVGYKVPTPQVVKQVADFVDRLQQPMASLWQTWEACTLTGIQALEAQNWPLVQDVWQFHHGLQVALGTSNFDLESLLKEVKAVTGIVAAKISGSGLGDSLIALGQPEQQHPCLQARRVAQRGLVCDA